MTKQGLDEVLGALADPTRRRMVELLRTRPYRAGELGREVGASAPSTSRHLRALLDAGLVKDERPPEDARARVFRLRPQGLTALVAWTDQMQAHWDEQLGSFKKHVERKKRSS